MKRLLVKRRRAFIVLICVSFVLTIILGIRLHLSVDLDALHSSADLVKQGLIQYTKDTDTQYAQKGEPVDSRKSNDKHKHNEQSFLDVVHLAAVKKGKEVRNFAAKKAFDKLAEAGFVSHNEGHFDTKNRTFGSSNKLEHHENRVRRESISVLIGVRPELSMHYENKKEFQCLDGRQKFPIDFVNNDYCDCTDDSDEPGTSACENGRFYCKKDNKYILSSHVDDTICDCCDGSDEWRMDKPVGFVVPQALSMRFSPCKDTC